MEVRTQVVQSVQFVGLGSACPWRALGGAECPVYGWSNGMRRRARKSSYIYKERAGMKKGLALLHASKLELSLLYLNNTVNIEIQLKRTSHFVCLVF